MIPSWLGVVIVVLTVVCLIAAMIVVSVGMLIAIRREREALKRDVPPEFRDWSADSVDGMWRS